MNKLRRRNGILASDGFTLVEVSVVILLIAILVTMAVPVYHSFRETAEHGVCGHNQRSISYSLMRWSADHPDERFITDTCLPGGGEAYLDLSGNVPGDSGRTLSEYFAEGLGPFDCPSNGQGVGAAAGACDYLTDGLAVACLTDNQISLRTDGSPFRHDRPMGVAWSHLTVTMETPAGKTPLGDTFDEITNGLIKLLEDFYRENGEYSRSWGDYVFTDIGLDPDDWKLPIDHILYSPGGARVKVTPENGYSFTVTDSKGKERVVKSTNNWSLWYDLKTENWYYKSVDDKNAVDISTLKVRKS